MAVRFKGEEQLQQRASGSALRSAEMSFESTSTGKRPGFYIGNPGSAAASTSTSIGSSGGFSRLSDFGDPSEVELASSDDDDGDDNDNEGDAKDSDGEGVRTLMYGKHFKQMHHKRKHDIRTMHDNTSSNKMDVDTENEPNSGSDSAVDDDDNDNDNDDDNDDNEQHPSTANFSTTSRPRDPSLAALLAARATGIEKVLQAMLAQPPSSPPRSPSPPPYALHSSHANSQHYRAPPPPPSSSSSTHPSPQPTVSGVSTVADQSRLLPNGLRLRLALMALVNDLFERQPLHGEQQPTTAAAAADDGSSSKPVSSGSASSSNSSKQTAAGQSQSAVASLPPLPPPSLPPPTNTLLPPEVADLAQISSQPFHAVPSLPSFHTLTLPSSSSGAGAGAVSSLSASSNTTQPANNRAGGGLGKGSMESGSSQSSAQQAQRPPPPLFSWTRPTVSAHPRLYKLFYN